uniref:Ig-like domain-containing protein n=1 Tax=Setaria digitata TaxID=48799 RepID=A0A915PVQ5_9BILA
MDEREKSYHRKASTSQDSFRMEVREEENSTNAKTIYQNGPIVTTDKDDKDGVTSYSTNREKVYRKNAGTIEETHILESSGRSTKDFAEEHWSSEIKSYVVPEPPKFMQVIKAFRVLATDTLTLVVEVQSDPPAIFEWFCNDRPVQQNRRKFKARHGINITTLTVEGPEQGVYKCTARNPVGVSTTYGYITVNAPPSYKTWLEQAHEVSEETNMEIVDKENIQTAVDVPPKFIQQIPNLTLRPGSEAIIDVEVEASPPAKFTWYVNGVQFRDNVGQIEVYYPMANRCIVRFPIPQKGEYKVIAENRAGMEQSVGYIDIKKVGMPHMQGRGRASSVSRVIDVYEESSYFQRSTSLPRQTDHPYEIKKTKEIIRKRTDDMNQQEQQYSSSLKELVETEQQQVMKRRRTSEATQNPLPQAPIFTDKLPINVTVDSGEDLVLSVSFRAFPQADVQWNVNGFELKDSKQVTVINEIDHSTLIVRPPIRYGRYNVTIMNEYGMCKQTTRVNESDGEQYEMVEEEILIRQSHSLPPEIMESASVTSALENGWELVDEQQRSSRSADSFETVKYVETVSQAALEGHATPTPSATSSRGQLSKQMNGPSQPLSKPMTPVIHEPLRGGIVSVTSDVAQRSSPYREKRYDEIARPVVNGSLTDTEQGRYMETVSAKSEAILRSAVSPKTSSSKEFVDYRVLEKRTFRIPIHRTMESIPKHPSILKQPEPEIRLKAGEKLVLESKVDSSPESQFKWYQNNFEVRPSPSVIIERPAINESRATFLKPVSGTYKVEASNIHGSCSSTTRVITEVTEEWTTESTVSMVRTVPEKREPKYQLVKRSHIETRSDLPKAPRIIKRFAPIIKIPKNESLVLIAAADAIPEAEFRWMLNNFEVRTNQTVTIERLGRNVSQATFRTPTSGRYEVVAANSLGQDSCSGKVIVEFADEKQPQQLPSIQQISKPITPRVPVFITPLPGEKQLHSENQQEFRLSVTVQGEQPITFRWFADGSLLSNSIEHQMINDLEQSTLVVRKQIDCDVDYAVEVSNNHGAVWSETTVKPPSLSLDTTKTSPESSLPEVYAAQRCSPRYTIVLVDMNVQQNDEFTAHVAIHEESSPCEFIWTLKGRDIRTIPGFRVESTLYESTLYVKSVTSKHSGELSVLARNKYGNAISKAKINVHSSHEELYEFISEAEIPPAEQPPRIISPLQPSVFRVGESLHLYCHIDGLPRPDVFWTKDEIPIDDRIPEKEIITLQYPDGRCELINPQCTPEDAGLYQLIARNIHGSVNTSAYINVEEVIISGKQTIQTTTTETKGEIQVIHQAISKPRFSAITSKQYEHETVVSCKLTSETPVQVSWYKDGQRLYQTYKYRMQKLSDNTYILAICNIDKWDEGTYICHAENTSGSSEVSIFVQAPVGTREISEEVLIEENTSEVIGLSESTDYVKKRYTDTTVKVLVEPEVTGSQEVYSHTAEIRKAEEEYKLLVKVAEIVASKLVAKVIIDEAIHIALKRMNVEIASSEEEEFELTHEHQPLPPRFETNIECYTVDIGDTVVLRTDIAGYPQPTVEWYFGEQKLEQSEQIDVKYVNQQATLTIKKVDKKQEGTYYCHAENDYGKAVLPCNLRVTDATHEWSESTHRIIRPPLTYTETEAEVSSNVNVTHAEESYEHYFSSIQPETFALGYSCIASTSKVHDDSVIITRDSMQKMMERKDEPTETYVTLNVNVERTPVTFNHDARILRSADESVSISQHQPQYTRAEEVIQTNNIVLVRDRRTLQQRQSVVNATATIVFEKPSQRALHEVTCLYDEKANITMEKVQAVSTIDLKKVEMINELISAVMATKDEFRKAYAEANVDARHPDATFDHFITVVESEHEHLNSHFIAPMVVRNSATINCSIQQNQESLHTDSVRVEYPKRYATAEQKIVILESLSQKFSEAITWSLKKIRKEASKSDIAVTYANVKVDKPEEISEYATTIIDARKMVPELLAIAAAASKLKITSVFVTFTKKGDVAHQALVIEYESFVEDEATLNVAMLTAPGFHSKQLLLSFVENETFYNLSKVLNFKESIWSYEKKYEKAEETETNVVAVFVEVDATCPNQTVELIASVSLPPNATGITSGIRSGQSVFELSSASWSESSSAGLFQAPKFIKTLENTTAIVGQFQQFKCIVIGAPTPTIRWYVDGDMIHDSDVYQTIYEDGVCILKIRELAIEDEGEYTCEATNDAGRAITKCFLRTITEADILKKQQQAISENIPYSNNRSKNRNNTDNLAFRDSHSTLSSASGIITDQNYTTNYNQLLELGGSIHNVEECISTVNYAFTRTESTNAETTAIVTRHTSTCKGMQKNLMNEERNFNISVFLPNAVMKCDFIWPVVNFEYNELNLILQYQAINFTIQIFQPQQAEKMHLLLSMRKVSFETVSFAICQIWEEILLEKKWENEFACCKTICLVQQNVRLEIATRSCSIENDFKRSKLKNVLMRCNSFSRSTPSFSSDHMKANDATDLISYGNGTVQLNETSEITANLLNHCNNEKDESKIAIHSQDISSDKHGNADRNDNDNLGYESTLRQASEEDPGIGNDVVAAIRRYVDEIFDFNPLKATILSEDEKDNIGKMNDTGSQMISNHPGDFINDEYLNCSFCRKPEHFEMDANRYFSVVALEKSILSSSYLTENLLLDETNNLNLNPDFENMMLSKEKSDISEAVALESSALEMGYDLDESLKQNLDFGNPNYKEDQIKPNTFSKCNPYSHFNTENYPSRFKSMIDSIDISGTYDAGEEFEILSSSPNSGPENDRSSAVLCNPSISEIAHTKSVYSNPTTVNSLISSGEIFITESGSPHGNSQQEMLSTIEVIDDNQKEVKIEAKLKSEENIEEALQIERAIYDISEQIERQQPLTVAQAEASEELLKTILENIIKNTGQRSVVETIAAYKKPIVLLREKVTDLEETLLREDLEFAESSLRSIPEAKSVSSKSLTIAESDQHDSLEREFPEVSSFSVQEIGMLNNQEITRMTPLTSNIKQQLQNLESMLEEVEKEEKSILEGVEREEKDEKTEELTSSEAKTEIPLYSDAKHHEVHNILMQINNEIGIIKRYCHRNISKTSVDSAVGLLHKVRNNVSSMIDLISTYRKRLRKKSPAEKGLNFGKERMKSPKHHLSPTSRTGFFFKTDASVNLYFVKREESDIINAIVKLSTAADKLENQMMKSENSEVSTYEEAAFDNESEASQGIKSINSLLQSTTDGMSLIMNETSSCPFPLEIPEHPEITPVPPPRRQKKMKQKRNETNLPSPVPPPRPKKHRSKSFEEREKLSANKKISSLSSSAVNLCKTEALQLDASDHKINQQDLLDILDLVNAKQPSISKSDEKLKKPLQKTVSFDAIIKKEPSFSSCSSVWSSKVKYNTSFEIFDESSSIYLICEDSDYAPESAMPSLLFFDSTKNVQEENETALLQTLALLSDLKTSATESVIDEVTERQENSAKLKNAKKEESLNTIELTKISNENSKMAENSAKSKSGNGDFQNLQNSTHDFHVSSDTKPQELSTLSQSDDDANSLHEIESIDDKDEIMDELDDLMIICNPHASVLDNVDLLPTIMEDSECSRNANSSFMSVSTNTVIALAVPNNDNPETNQYAGKIIAKDAYESDITTSTSKQEGTNISNSNSDSEKANYLDDYNRRIILIRECDAGEKTEETTVNVAYKNSSSKLKVLAILSPEIRAKAEAYTIIGEDFDVLIEQPDEIQNFTAKITDHVNDMVSLDLMLPNTIEVDLSLKQHEQYEGILSYQIENLTGGETDEEKTSRIDDSGHNHRHSPNAIDNQGIERCAGISVNIIARSMHDVARASLEEIPWGEVSMYVVIPSTMTRSATDSEARNSLIQNVTVSESNETEKRSLRSHDSFHSSSHHSFDWNELGDNDTSWQNIDVPSYVVKQGSTATITCEFNNFLTPGSFIDWYKGKARMQIVPGKTDRISHDLLEVLVISQVNLTDGDIYSIRVNDIIYPVAYLIVEDATASMVKLNDNIHFISPPQTLFVMEGQPSIISCQVNRAEQKIEWCKDNKKWITENERIRLESDQYGYHRIVIDKSELEDQGTYYAFLGDHFTTVTLVVEERIDEREVTVNALGTDTEEDDYHEYLVPLGSTATIACELENSNEVEELIWRKNGVQIEFTDDAKIEHVVNGLKHYLVIHDTQIDDSASYSICINNIEFKIAHLIVSGYATTIGSNHTKRISSTSLH